VCHTTSDVCSNAARKNPFILTIFVFCFIEYVTIFRISRKRDGQFDRCLIAALVGAALRRKRNQVGATGDIDPDHNAILRLQNQCCLKLRFAGFAWLQHGQIVHYWGSVEREILQHLERIGIRFLFAGLVVVFLAIRIFFFARFSTRIDPGAKRVSVLPLGREHECRGPRHKLFWQ